MTPYYERERRPHGHAHGGNCWRGDYAKRPLCGKHNAERGACPYCPRCTECDKATSLCDCGCGLAPPPGRRFVTGHNLKTLERTAAHRAAISAACKVAWATKREQMPIGARRANAGGYVVVKVAKGERWRLEHVVVMETRIGRRIKPPEEVHHVNGVRDDNRPENLCLCAGFSEHRAAEASYWALLKPLLDSGVIEFDHLTKRYKVR